MVPARHGDLYPAMLGSGMPDKLLEKGSSFMFAFTSDNLDATMDLKLLTYLDKASFTTVREGL